VICHDRGNLLLVLGESDQLLLELLQLWVLGIESLKLLIDLVLPEPVEVLEALQELVDIVLCSLNGTSKKQDNLNDFLVLGDPVIEWLSLVLWLVLLVPILHVLGRLKDVRGSSVDGALNFLKGWLESTGVSLKMDIHLEEWLKDLLWHVSSSANSFLHLIKGVFGGVEKSLIHRPVVVLAQLLDLLSRDWLDMLVQLVRADGLD
jgi:hypothetical protein